MYSKTIDEIQADILNNIPDTYQKTIGFEMWDFSRAAAKPMSDFLTYLDEVYGKNDVENLSGDELTKWVFQRKGIIRHLATYGTTFLTVVGANFSFSKGVIIETLGGIQFEVTADSTTSPIAVKCLTIGSVGNVVANSITVMPVTIAGVVSVTNDTEVTNGYDEESDADLRIRYYEACQAPATSGNKYHYKNWAKEVTGVGDAKVFPLENGDNTVTVVIIDSNKHPADSSLITEVQNYIDPGSQGKGEGEAPIGAYCTIESAIAKNLNISFVGTLASGYTHDDVYASAQTSINNYFASIAFKQNYISYAKIGDVILDSEGLEDYAGLTVNGGTSNISLADKEVPILNNLVIS